MKHYLSILDSYETRNIFNSDEAGLFYKLLPNKSLMFKIDDCSGGKKYKERLSVMICTNMDSSEHLCPNSDTLGISETINSTKKL